MAERTMPAGEVGPDADPAGSPTTPAAGPPTTTAGPAGPATPAGDAGTGAAVRLTHRPDPQAVSTATEFTDALSRLRDQAGVDVGELARRGGITTSTLGDWLTGRRLPPAGSVRALESVLAACGVPAGRAREAWLEALARARRLPGRQAEPSAPYRGLDSYRAQDSSLFFGRERLVARLVAAVTAGAPGGTVLVGPGGCGKSSALQAGLAARLRSGAWEVVTLTPGAEPLAALDTALAQVRAAAPRAGSQVALIVDQFEELFTLCTSPSHREQFVTRLVTPLGPAVARTPGGGPQVSVVLGLRAEYYGTALGYPALAPVLQDHQVVAAPMTPDDLRRAVADPARACGVQLEPGLVELVQHDAGADDLPLVSFALLQAWRRGLGTRITLADYLAAGGVGGAVMAAAEGVYDLLTPSRQDAARHLLLRLVALGDGGPDALHRLTAAELGLDTPDGDEATEVVERFVEAGLLTTTDTTVQIAHQPVLTAGPRLAGWRHSARADRRARRRLADAARVWDRGGRDPALLRPHEPAPGDGTGLVAVEQDYLAAVTALRARPGDRTRRRHRRTVAALAAVTAAALGTGYLAVAADRDRSTTAAEADRTRSRRLAVAADRLRHVDPTLAGQVAVLAWRTARTPQARSALLDSSAAPLPGRVAGPGGATAVAASADGGTVAALGDRGGLRVWHVQPAATADAVPAFTELGTITAPDGKPLSAVAVTRDGRLVAAAGAAGVLRLWDTSSGRPEALPPVPLGRGAVLALAAGADGRTLAAATSDGRVVRYDVRGTRLVMLGVPLAAAVGGAVQAVAFSPDGRTLAAAGPTGRVQLWSLADRLHPATGPSPSGPTAAVTALAFTPDGRRLVAGSRDQNLYLWQVAAPSAPAQRVPAGGAVAAVAPSPDGALLAVATGDHQVHVIETAGRARLADLPHPAAVTGAAYLPDGHTLLTAAADGALRLWPSPAPTVAVPAGRITGLGYLDGGRLAAVTGKDGARVFDVSQRYRPRPLGPATGPGRPALTGVTAVAPSGSLAAAAAVDGSVRLYQAPSTSGGTATRVVGSLPRVPGGPARALAFSPDGTALVVGTDAGLQVHDVSTPSAPRALGSPVPGEGSPTALAVSPDGHRLAVGSAQPGRVALWDLSAPDRLSRIGTTTDGTARVTALAFAPDGRTVAVGSADRAVRLLDVSGPGDPRWTGTPTPGAGDDVLGVAFDRSGHLLAAAGADTAVRLWDVSRPSAPVLVALLDVTDGDPVTAVAFDRDGGRLAAAAGTSIWQWESDPEAALTRVCGLAGAPVPPELWARYLPDVPYTIPCR